MKFVISILLILMNLYPIYSQVGIGTTLPDNSAILDIKSIEKGILIPRLTSAQKGSITLPEKGLLVFNTDTNKFEYNHGTKMSVNWKSIPTINEIVSTDIENKITIGSDGGAYLNSTQHFGKFIINAAGNINITGLPFRPSKVKFTAYTNIDTENLDNDNAVGDNNNGIPNTFGSTNGYAIEISGVINEQCIFIGGNANSINDITRYASNSHCLGLRYANQNGNSLGKTTATLTSFDTNGFTLNIDQYSDGVIVLYEAYK
jgi:hypothetical protein|tara:strand:+ start:963 stop:1742 length:780 start_codon:yes stop_codon:yes gene_type:complete